MDSLDYILIVDKNYRIVYNTRYDATLNARSKEYDSSDVLNKYYTINQMPIASGRYWNNGFGRAKGEVEGDVEGIQNARFVARNMLFLMKSIALGKEQFGLPEAETVTRINYIR